MTRQQRKTIEREFFGYAESMKKAAKHVSERAYDAFSRDLSQPRVRSSPKGNAEEEELVDIISENERAWKWCKVFEKTLDRFRWTQKDELMRRRYIKGETDTATCIGIGISRSTYYLWVEEIIISAFMWAREYRLF